MLRKKPSIHTFDIISSSLSQISASSSPSSNKTLIPVLKTLPWIHHRRRSSVAAAERYDFSPSDPKPVGSDIGSPTNSQHQQQQIPNGFYGGNYSRNSVGHQRSDLGNFRPSNMNPSGFYIGNSAGFQTNNLGMVRQNSGFHGECSQMGNGYHGENIREGHLPIPMGSYGQNPRNNGEFQQTLYRQKEYQSSYGYNRENPVQQNFGDSPFLSVPNINDGESAQNSAICNYKGTLGELDEFSNEGKVKEAVEILNLLEKNGMVIDLPRYLTFVASMWRCWLS